MLFIVAHQVHELWFKQLLCELLELQRHLGAGASAKAQHALHRALAVFRTLTSPIDVLDTLTPRQFTGFRLALGNGSGFQSAQFREIEAVLGRRDTRISRYFPADSPERVRIEAAMTRPSLFDSLLGYLSLHGYPVPLELLHRDVTRPAEPSEKLQRVLLDVYFEDDVAAQLCEGLAAIDQCMQEWRYRHVSMVERMIGAKTGTGGSSGASYLRNTLFVSMFPDLWAVRSQL
jgi:tryptophan 2,3-dioxygenase